MGATWEEGNLDTYFNILEEQTLAGKGVVQHGRLVLHTGEDDTTFAGHVLASCLHCLCRCRSGAGEIRIAGRGTGAGAAGARRRG